MTEVTVTVTIEPTCQVLLYRFKNEYTQAHLFHHNQSPDSLPYFIYFDSALVVPKSRLV